MFMVISHFPTDDINCPGIEAGPIGATREQAIQSWKEHRIAVYLESGARDPEWDPDQPDSTEGKIYDLAAELMSKSGDTGVIFADAEDEQVYLVEVPATPASGGAEKPLVHISLLVTEEEAGHLCDTLEVGRDEEAPEHLSQLPFDVCDSVRQAIHNAAPSDAIVASFQSSATGAD